MTRMQQAFPPSLLHSLDKNHPLDVNSLSVAGDAVVFHGDSLDEQVV